MDFFLQLTDDILLLILSLLSYDLKFLCQCFLVSKRFAYLIPLISTATLSIPPSLQNFSPNFLLDQATYANDALRKFHNIRSLHLEFIEEKYQEVNLWWKAVFGPMTYTCACLVFNSITRPSCAGVSASATGAENRVDILSIDGPIYWRIVYPNMWRNLLAVVAPQIESVVITDSKKAGMVCVGNSELRDATICSGTLDLWENRWVRGQTSIKVFKVPVLPLPKSGFLMKGVSLVIMKMGGGSPEDHKYDDLLNFDFGEDEKVLGESLNLILKAPKEKMMESHIMFLGLYLSVVDII